MAELAGDLYRRYGGELATALALSLDDRAEAHAHTHRAFLRAASEPDGLRARPDARLWLYSTAYASARRRLGPFPFRAPPLLEAHPLLSDDGWREAAELRAVLQGLDASARDAVVLQLLTGLASAQVAVVVDETEGAVRAHLRRGLDALYPPPGSAEDVAPEHREQYLRLLASAGSPHADLQEDLEFVEVEPLARDRRLPPWLAAPLALLVAALALSVLAGGDDSQTETRKARPALTSPFTSSRLPAPTFPPRATAVRAVAVQPTAPRPCISPASASGVHEVVEEFGDFDGGSMPSIKQQVQESVRIVIATAREAQPAHWNTPDGCEPDYTLYRREEGMEPRLPTIFTPVRLRVETTLKNKLDLPPDAPYALLGGTVGGQRIRLSSGSPSPRALTPGRRYLLFLDPLLDAGPGASLASPAARALTIGRAYRIDERGRAILPGGRAVRLAELVQRIREQAGPRALLASPELPPSRPGPNRIKLRGITYEGDWRLDDSHLSDHAVGPLYGVVRYELGSGERTPDLARDPPDGAATSLSVGTELYRLNRYRPGARVAAYAYGRLLVYQAVDNPRARTGADILGIEGRVRAMRSELFDPATRGAKRTRVSQSPAALRGIERLVGRARVTERAAPDDAQAIWVFTLRLSDGIGLRFSYAPRLGRLRLEAGTSAVPLELAGGSRGRAARRLDEILQGRP